MEKMHYLKWEHSRLNIRCWQCSEILVTISTDGSSLNFKSNVEYLEISCPICHTTCEYSLIEKEDGLFNSHDWDSDIESLDFDGKTGEVNRNLLRQYKTLLLAGEASKKFMENEFYIATDCGLVRGNPQFPEISELFSKFKISRLDFLVDFIKQPTLCDADQFGI